LLNRESNNVNRWTKACTLYAIAENEAFTIDDAIVAHMFNPDPLLAELATGIIYKNQPDQYRSVLKRMSHRPEVTERIVHRVENNLPLVFDVVLKLREMPEFKGFTGLLLSQIVTQMQLVRLAQGEKLSLSKNSQYIYIIRKGRLSTSIGNKLRVSNPKDSNIVGALFNSWEDEPMVAEAKENSILFGISLSDVFDILTNYPHLIIELTKYVSNQYSKTEQTT